jgi:hypothetical protein
MISRALRDGVIPTNWRELIWEESGEKVALPMVTV